MTSNESTGDKAPARHESTASDYQFPSNYKGSKLATDAESINAVFAAVRAAYDDGRQYVSSADLDIDGLDRTDIGKALRCLADDAGCPLTLECWSGASSSPKTYRVERRDAEIVWIKSPGNGRTRNHYHTDRECRALERAEKPVRKSLAVLADDIEQCAYCAGEDIDRNHKGTHDHINSLKELSVEEFDELVTDGGYDIDPDAYYVLDSLEDTVVAGPTDREQALAEARARGPEDNIVVSGASLRQLVDARTVAWETDDGEPTVVTDGGSTFRVDQEGVAELREQAAAELADHLSQTSDGRVRCEHCQATGLKPLVHDDGCPTLEGGDQP